MSAADILKMIEEVSPDDNEALCTINGMVDWYVKRHAWYPNCTFVKAKRYKDQSCPNEIIYLGTDKETHSACNGFLDYCKSRDALKAIRPEGCWVERIIQHKTSKSWDCTIAITGEVFSVSDKAITLPTEELAELHAIIQAIEYERNAP